MKKFIIRRTIFTVVFIILATVSSVVETSFSAKSSSEKEQVVLMQASENPNLVTFETVLKVYDTVSCILHYVTVLFIIGIIAEVISVIIYIYRRQI